MTYRRVPGEQCASGAFAYDGRTVSITRIERWPVIGSTSLVWFDDPSAPAEREQWRQSSTIVRIVEIPD